MTNGDIEIFRHIFEIGTDEDKGVLISESFFILRIVIWHILWRMEKNEKLSEINPSLQNTIVNGFKNTTSLMTN